MTTDPVHIVFAESFHAEFVERAGRVGKVTVLAACDETTLAEAVRDCDALLVRSAARVTRKVVDQARRLRVIGRGGAGLDNIDLEAARDRGIVVVHTPQAATDAAADLTVGLILNLVRKITLGDALIRDARFLEGRAHCMGTELCHLTLGIIGMGRIGRGVARRCRNGFGMRILYNDIIRIGHLDFVATPAEKDDLYAQSDVVSLHVPLTDLTRGLIDGSALRRFKPGAVLVNASRGAVVEGPSLARALVGGSLAGAALDVFDPEPLPKDHPLMTAPNTLFTPHIGARTHGALERMNAVVDDVLGVLQGTPPHFPA